MLKCFVRIIPNFPALGIRPHPHAIRWWGRLLWKQHANTTLNCNNVYNVLFAAGPQWKAESERLVLSHLLAKNCSMSNTTRKQLCEGQLAVGSKGKCIKENATFPFTFQSTELYMNLVLNCTPHDIQQWTHTKQIDLSTSFRNTIMNNIENNRIETIFFVEPCSPWLFNLFFCVERALINVLFIVSYRILRLVLI